MTTRPRWIPWAAVAAIVMAAGAGWLCAGLFQSPAQQEADARPPSAAPVFATVAQGSLSEESSFTGSVGPASEIPVTLHAVPDTAVSVVTGAPVTSGTAVSSGRILTEVNGRPVFLVRSPFAFYRDIGFADRGPDVTSL